MVYFMGGDHGCSTLSLCSGYTWIDADTIWDPGTGTVGLTHRFRRVKRRRPTPACRADHGRCAAVVHDAVSDPFHHARPTRVPSARRWRRRSARDTLGVGGDTSHAYTHARHGLIFVL